MDSWDLPSLAVEPHRPQVLRSDDEVRVIVINLPAGEALREHRVHERTYLFVADGEIEIEGDGSVESGGTGYLAHFDAGEDHEVRAKTDTRLLMLLAPWPGEGHPSYRT